MGGCPFGGMDQRDGCPFHHSDFPTGSRSSTLFIDRHISAWRKLFIFGIQWTIASNKFLFDNRMHQKFKFLCRHIEKKFVIQTVFLDNLWIESL